MSQSKTYNNGKILEYIYNIVPLTGSSYKESVFIDISSGIMVNPKDYTLTIDANSEDTFQGICCSLETDCDGWITNENECWVTDSGDSWSF